MVRILDLPHFFRPSTSHVYPPFKNGKYMEEYFYDSFQELDCNHIYIPIFWTNIQNHPGFSKMKEKYNHILRNAFHKILSIHPNAQFFTIVQHDDGPLLYLPNNTVIFGACTGKIPLPLIYQDITNKLSLVPRVKKDMLASFVGSYTHPIRQEMYDVFSDKYDCICHVKNKWTSNVQENDANTFIDLTLRSKFCLSPRGYGRSSFRFFEAILLDTIPVYFWDDIEWLPYKDILDYSLFSISIAKKDIPYTYDILSSISDARYEEMCKELQRVKYFFTLDYMSIYISNNL